MMSFSVAIKLSFYLLLLKSVIAESESGWNADSNACQLVSRRYLEMNLPVEDVPRTPSNGASLHVCKKSLTCCTEAMETKLSVKALNDGLNVFKDTEVRLNSFVDSRVKSFQGLIDDFFNESYNEFNSMFSRTYGFQYQDNKALFTTLFDQMRAYHPGSINNLRPLLNQFFRLLFRKMFVLINHNPKFKPEFLNCMESQMTQLAPFGDKATLLTDQLIRVFVTTRTYVQAFQVARSIISSVYKQVKLTPDCGPSLLRLRYCNLCSGRTTAPLPCLNSCLHVVRSCFEQQALLHPHWTRFIDILSRTADVVAGPFNLKVILKPLGFKISDAIMAFQHSNEVILQKVTKICGRALDAGQVDQQRSKRQIINQNNENVDGKAPGGDNVAGDLGAQNTFGWRYDNLQDSTSNSGTIEHMIKETMAIIKSTYNMWKSMPEEQLCTARRVALPNRQCWNGTAINSHDSVVTPMAHKVEVGAVITRSIDLLKLITSNLDKALKGEEVDYIKNFLVADEPSAVNLKSPSLFTDNGSGEEGSGDSRVMKLIRRTTAAAQRSLTTTALPDQESDLDVEIDTSSGDGNRPLGKTRGLAVTPHRPTTKRAIMSTQSTQPITTTRISVAVTTSSTRKSKPVASIKPIVVEPDGSSGTRPDEEGGPDDLGNGQSSSGDAESIKSQLNGGSGGGMSTESVPLRTVQPNKGLFNGHEGQVEKADVLGKDLWPEPKSDKGGAEIGLGSVEMAAKAQIGTNNVICQASTCGVTATSKTNGIFITVLVALVATVLVVV